MADEYKRINLLIGTQSALAAGQEEGMPGIVSDSAYRLGVYAAGAWRLMALHGGAETFSALSISGLTNGKLPRISTAGGLLADSAFSDDGTIARSSRIFIASGSVVAGDGIGGIPGSLYAIGIGTTWASTYMLHDGQNRIVTRFNPIANVYEIARRNDDGSPRDVALSISRDVNGAASYAGAFAASKQILQWPSELVTSGRYVKTTDTTVGPSAASKASLLNGATTGFMAVTDPAARWNAVGAASETVLKGNVSSAANQVLVFELYRNGAVSATLTLQARSYGTATPWRLVIDQVVRVAGATGTVRVKMRAYVTADNINSAASCYDMSATLTGVDLTVAHTWDVVCTIPNNSSNSITCDYAKKIG